MEKDPWTFSLREGNIVFDDSESDDSSILHMAQKRLHRSASDDDAPFKENPWSIAKVNAASRKTKSSVENPLEHYPSSSQSSPLTRPLSIEPAFPNERSSKGSSDQDAKEPPRDERVHQSSMLMLNLSHERTLAGDTCPIPTQASGRSPLFQANMQLEDPVTTNPPSSFPVPHYREDSPPAQPMSQHLCAERFPCSQYLAQATPSLSYPSSPTLYSPASPSDVSKTRHTLSDDILPGNTNDSGLGSEVDHRV